VGNGRALGGLIDAAIGSKILSKIEFGQSRKNKRSRELCARK